MTKLPGLDREPASTPKSSVFGPNHQELKEHVATRIRAIQALGLSKDMQYGIIKQLIHEYKTRLNGIIASVSHRNPNIFTAGGNERLSQLVETEIANGFDSILLKIDLHLFPDTNLKRSLSVFSDGTNGLFIHGTNDFGDFWSIGHRPLEYNRITEKKPYDYNIPLSESLIKTIDSYKLDRITLFPPYSKEHHAENMKRVFGITPEELDLLEYRAGRDTLRDHWHICLYRDELLAPNTQEESAADFLQRLQDDGLAFDTLLEHAIQELDIRRRQKGKIRNTLPILMPHSTIAATDRTARMPLISHPSNPIKHIQGIQPDAFHSGHWAIRPKLLIPIIKNPGETEKSNFGKPITHPLDFKF